jgi:hypothetical protein
VGGGPGPIHRLARFVEPVIEQVTIGVEGHGRCVAISPNLTPV